MLIPRATGPPFFNEMHSNHIAFRSFHWRKTILGMP